MSKDVSSVNRNRDQDVPSESLLGQWFWVKSGKAKWFGCVTDEGSNYVELSAVNEDRSFSRQRIHHNEMDKFLEADADPQGVISERIAFFQGKVAQLMVDVQEMTARLGVVPATAIANQASSGLNSLAIMSEQADTTGYKNALIKAKEETLPQMFKDIEAANLAMAGWMGASTMSLMATITPLKATVAQIEERIETVSLYAGLTEEAVKCCDGDPAARGEKLHVMQRRLYMDEECMLSYTGGGIDIKEIKEFDAWIARPENRDRIFPFPRTIVAFRVRRKEKDRGDSGSIAEIFVKIQLKDADKRTFLYVRNGDQVWRIDADFKFGEMIFPDQSEFDPSQPMMVRSFGSRPEFMLRSAWEVMQTKEREQHRLYKEWEAANPDKSWIENPHHNSLGFRFESNEYKPFDPTNVYFDDASKEISERIKRYNRIAVIIQGLFDRSLVLHPHDPVKVWDPVSFSASIKLVYDGSTLTSGDKPDFEAYRARLNALITDDSVLTGQEDYWMADCAQKANERSNANARRHGGRGTYYHRYRPYENPGPGLVSLATSVSPRAKKAKFSWRMTPSWNEVEGKPRTISVPFGKLLNVSAYKPGDFKQFFNDPRTRQEYLHWAPLMLAAEDYHAGKAALNAASYIPDQYR